MKGGRLNIRLSCARCRRSFHPWRKTQACCSIACARKYSPHLHAHLRMVAVQGGKAAGRLRRLRQRAKWQAEASGWTKGELAAKFYRRGYHAGEMAGERRGYRKGFEAAAANMEAGR